jgi:hypothetical protein
MIRSMRKCASVLFLVLALGCKKKGDALPDGGVPTDGGVSQDDVLKVIRAVRPKMEQCYDDALIEKPNLAGKIILVFAINRDGTVDKTRLGLGGQAGDPAFAQCVLDIVAKQTFPPPSVITDVQLPLDLSKRKGADAGVDAAADVK